MPNLRKSVPKYIFENLFLSISAVGLPQLFFPSLSVSITNCLHAVKTSFLLQLFLLAFYAFLFESSPSYALSAISFLSHYTPPTPNCGTKSRKLLGKTKMGLLSGGEREGREGCGHLCIHDIFCFILSANLHMSSYTS